MKKILDFRNRSYSDVIGKYQNMEKPLKHQRRLGLVVRQHKKVEKYYFHQFYCNTFFEVEETKFVQLPIKPKVQYEGVKRFLQLFLELIIT